MIWGTTKVDEGMLFLAATALGTIVPAAGAPTATGCLLSYQPNLINATASASGTAEQSRNRIGSIKVTS